MPRDTASFFVPGEPVPKGSTKSFPFKRKNGKLGVSTTNSNPDTEAWQNRVSLVASEENRLRGEPFFRDDRLDAFEVEATFYFTKPKSTPRWWRFHTKRPDLDKLQRALLDGLTNVLFPDDSQVDRLNVGKEYADTEHPPGVRVIIKRKMQGPPTKLKPERVPTSSEGML